jgi:ATP-dependent RNA helicase RhlE
MQFSLLGLSEPIVRAVGTEGYQTPTPIQSKAIPHIIAGKDLLGCAQTGTGKTAAFALPLLHRLGGTPPVFAAPAPALKPGQHVHQSHGPKSGKGRRIRALILSPTRELASQIAESFRAYGKNVDLRGAVIFGGVSQGAQTRALQAGVDILVATPGRLLDLMDQGYIDLRSVQVFVLDEADRMLDMGFIEPIRKIVAKIPKERQTLMFSATMPPPIRALANSILRDPVSVEVTPVSSAVDKIEQSVYFVEKRQKPELLVHFLKGAPVTRALVFTRTKHGADKVVRQLYLAGISAEAIHGNKSQSQRTRAMTNFKSGRAPVLVATDVAARGIDVDNISHVFNYDLPVEPETYVHRIGRTARAGASGHAVSFCDVDERGTLRAIERLIKKQIPFGQEAPELTSRPPAHAPDPHPRSRPHARAGGHKPGPARDSRPARAGASPGSRGRRRPEGSSPHGRRSRSA